MPRSILGIALLFAGLAAPHAAAQEVAAIVSPKVGVSALTSDELADIYLGRTHRFPDGTLVTPCDLAESSPVRAAFYHRVLGRTPAQMKAHWAKLMFTGRGQPPREVADSEEAKRLVTRSPGTLCYVERTAVDASVRVLLTR